LDPTWAEPYYARWVALHLTDRQRLYHYTEDDPEVLRSPEVRRIDSLAYRAHQLNPFFFRRLAYLWNETWWRQAVITHTRGRMPYSEEQLNYLLDSLITADTSTNVRGWLAYSKRDFRSSLRHYATLLNDEDYDAARVHAWRGHIFYLVRQYDSAQVAFANALEELQQRDENELVVLYESKAMMEYSVGLCFEAMGRKNAATEAYARALVEDLSFYPAHQRLALLAIAAGDTAAALAEFEMAAESDPTVALPLIHLGKTLHAMGRHREAADVLVRAMSLEPYYAEIYYTHGLSLEALGDREGALSSYLSFSGLAKASDERQAAVAEKISRLGGQQ
jgi:tetratricopeptide (TPR) repeat protein